MIKKFLLGMVMGIVVAVIALSFVFAFIHLFDYLITFCKSHHLNLSLAMGFSYVLLIALMFGVLSINNKL